MKGVVFTEFLDFVEGRHGPAMVDTIIEDCDLSTNGAYTSVGTYPFSEMRDLLMALSTRSGAAPGELLRAFGHKLAATFTKGYAAFFNDAGSLFGLLASIDNHIHVEVQKLYPDAELPSLSVVEHTADRFVMDYRSSRGLEALAEGLIEASAAHYNEPVDMALERSHDDSGSFVRFTLQKRAA